MTDNAVTEEIIKGIEQLVLAERDDEAIAKLNEFKVASVPSELLVRYYFAYGDAYFHQEKCNEALVKYKRSFDAAEATGERSAQAAALEQIGVILHRMDRLRDAFNYHMRSLEIWRSLGDVEGLGRAYRNIGNAYVGAGDSRRAVEYFEKSSEFFRQANKPDELAPAIMHKASLLYSQGNFRGALDVYRDGIEKDSCHHYLVYNNFGFLLLMDRKYDEALQMLDSARRDIAARHAGDDDLALTEINYGMAQALKGELSQAEMCWRKALELLDGGVDSRAVLLLLQDNEKYRDQGFSECLVVDNALKRAIAKLNLAVLLSKMGKREEAMSEAKAAIALDGDSAYPYLAAGWVFLANGDEDKAGIYMQRAHSKEPGNEEFKKALKLVNPYVLQKVGRNDPCPCGSGKKFKRCHGANV